MNPTVRTIENPDLPEPQIKQVNKHTIIVSKCCGASTDPLRGGYNKNDVWYFSRCNKCNTPCENKTIFLTPDTEIAEVLRTRYNKKISSLRDEHENMLIYYIAQKLQIDLEAK